MDWRLVEIGNGKKEIENRADTKAYSGETDLLGASTTRKSCTTPNSHFLFSKT
jgi:hypothetical protein